MEFNGAKVTEYWPSYVPKLGDWSQGFSLSRIPKKKGPALNEKLPEVWAHIKDNTQLP